MDKKMLMGWPNQTPCFDKTIKIAGLPVTQPHVLPPLILLYTMEREHLLFGRFMFRQCLLPHRHRNAFTGCSSSSKSIP